MTSEHRPGDRTSGRTDRLKQISLRFEDSRFRVSAADPGDLRWLASFVEDAFEVVPSEPPDFQVVFRVDPEAYDRCMGRTSLGTGAVVEGFAQDSNSSPFERCPEQGAQRTFYDTRKDCFHVLSSDASRVEILARESNPRVYRTVLMRVIRELAMDRVVSSGGVLVHGAVVGTARGAIALCGPKKSGKTTALMALLQCPGTRYIANDRCVLRTGPSGATLRGLPTLVSIRARTLDFFSGMRERVGDIRPDVTPSTARFSLTPPQFRKLLGGCPAEAEGPLVALLYPRVTDDAERAQLRRLDGEEALMSFRAGLFRAGKATILGDVFFPDGADHANRTPAESCEGIESWIPSVSCYELRLGGGGPPDPGECAELLRAVGSAQAADVERPA